MFKKRWIVTFFLLFSSILWGKEEVGEFIKALSEEQKVILEQFLKTVVQDSFSGYVLYGNKPICIEAHPLSHDSGALSGISEQTTILTKGMEFWQDLNLFPSNKNYLFLIFNAEELGYRHLICINRAAFIKVVNENLSLFRYVLGPTLTAETLLQDLIKAKGQFYKVLKNDNALLGILLGYGTQNSILVSRKEDISDAFFYDRNETFPFVSKIKRKRLSKLPKIQGKRPSLGFTSLDEEYEALKKTYVVSRKIKPFSTYQIPYFGCEPDSKESKNLLALYEKNREEIEKICEGKSFLEETLLKLFTTTSNTIDIPQIPENRPLFLSQNKEDIVSRLVAVIHQEIKDEKLLTAFLQGIEARENEISTRADSKEMIKREYQLYSVENELKRQENLKRADAYFTKLSINKKLFPLIPNRIYYKVLCPGKGARASSKIKNISFHYTFNFLNEKKSKAEIGTVEEEDLEYFIPGVALSLIDMKRGEKRKIYIHPEYGYGEETYLPPNVTIVAIIELIDFEEGDREAIPASPHTIEKKDLQELLMQYERLQKDQFYTNGIDFWDFIKKGNTVIDYETVRECFTKNQQNTSSFEDETQKEKFLTDLHWLLQNP